MALCAMWALVWIITMATGSLATNDTDPTSAPDPTRPEFRLPLDTATIAGLAVAGAIIIIVIVTFLVCVTCIGIYQVCVRL